MLRLLRLLLTCLALTIVLWFAVSVPVGKFTLWEHAKRIANTREARDLSDGAKATAKEAATRMQREVEPAAPAVPKK